jgi:hypothetical protein
VIVGRDAVHTKVEGETDFVIFGFEPDIESACPTEEAE